MAPEDTRQAIQEAEPEIPPLPEGYTYATVSDKISSIVLGQRTRLGWFVGFGVSFLLVMLLFYAIGCLLVWGVGIWGINIRVAWGFPSSNISK